MRLRRLEYDGRQAAGPWVVWKPADNARVVHVNSIIMDGDYLGNEVLLLLFRMSLRSNFMQRLAMAKFLKFHPDDRRIVWAKQHEIIGRNERLNVNLSARTVAGSPDAMFFAVVGEVLPFVVEIFGNFQQ